MVEKILETEKQAKALVDSARAQAQAIVQNARKDCDNDRSQALAAQIKADDERLKALEADYDRQLENLKSDLQKADFDPQAVKQAALRIVQAVIK